MERNLRSIDQNENPDQRETAGPDGCTKNGDGTLSHRNTPEALASIFPDSITLSGDDWVGGCPPLKPIVLPPWVTKKANEASEG